MNADNQGVSALCAAANYGLHDTVDQLIQAGADVNKVPEGGITAVMEACACYKLCPINTPPSHFLRCLELLIDAGADVNTAIPIPNKPEAIIIASFYGFSEGLDLLIRAGADVNRLSEQVDLTPLITASACGHLPCVRLLLQAGADVNLANCSKFTPLMKVYTALPSLTDANGYDHVNNCHDNVDYVECLKLLLRSEAKINVRNEHSHNALQHHVTHYDGTATGTAICSLLHAAGESVESIPDDKIPKCLRDDRIGMELYRLCRRAIRQHLISLDPQRHLFYRIPLLPLPAAMVDFLLYGLTLER